MVKVDPITLAVIRGALDSISLEMDNTLAAAAFSTSMAEGRDFGNGIFEAETGEVITSDIFCGLGRGAPLRGPPGHESA